MGTKPEAIDLAEDRDRFSALYAMSLPSHIRQLGMADHYRSRRERWLPDIGFPLLVRPSYVLGGRGMGIVYDDGQSRSATWPRPAKITPDHPVYLDRFLEGAVELRP